MKKRVLQRLLDVAEFELAGCINKHTRLLAAYHDGRRERSELTTEIGVLENRVKLLRAGLEDGRRERSELRDEVAELKGLLFNRGTPTPNPQPQPLRSTPRRSWRADTAPSGAGIPKPRPWWKSAPS